MGVTMSTLQIHVGDKFAATERRVMDGIARHDEGKEVVEHHLTFENWQTFARVMTPIGWSCCDTSIVPRHAACWRSRAHSAGITSGSMRTWRRWPPPACSIGTSQVCGPTTTPSGSPCDRAGSGGQLVTLRIGHRGGIVRSNGAGRPHGQHDRILQAPLRRRCREVGTSDV